MPLDPNAFARGFETTNNMVGGIANSFRQGAQENALRTYAMNPNDPNAVNALAQNGDPRLALQVRQQQQQAQAAKQEKDTAMIASLARDAKDPASFDAAVDQVVAMGYPDAAQFKGKFSPGLRSALMAAGGIKDEASESPFQAVAGQPGAGVYRFDKRTGTMTELVRANDGTGMAGAPVATPGGGPQPGVVEGGYRFKGGDPARQENWEPVASGGPTPQASGTFRP